MTSFTDPRELFREITDLHALLGEIVSSDLTTIRHWPTYCLMYVDVDRIGWDIRAVGRCLTEPVALRSRGFDNEMAAAEHDICASLHRRVRAIARWLERWASSSMVISIGDEALRHRLHSHFRPKSAWRDAFLQEYCAGRMSQDGLVFERTVLLLDPQPTYRMPDVHDKNLLQRQRFDLAANAGKLADAIEQVRQHIGTVQRAMMRRFTSQCRIEDLMHPSSM